MSVVAQERIDVEGGELPLTVVRGAGQGAAVVVMPSAFGVTADLVAQLQDLARDASAVVTFDPFFRTDGGPAEYGDMKRVMARIGSLDRERCAADLRAMVTFARERSADGRVVVIGICFGGPFALVAAEDGLVDGAVTWHGTRLENFLARASEARCPLRFHFGSVDPVTPPAAIEAVRGAFANHPDARTVVHDGATHGFTHRAAPAYLADAERAAVQSVRELVARR